jgi:hypothetical protein
MIFFAPEILPVCHFKTVRRRVNVPLMKSFLAAIVFLGWMAGRALAADTVLFSENFSHGISKGWKNIAFFKTATDYRVVRDGTNLCLCGLAVNSCSAFSKELAIKLPATLKLRWRWKIDGVATNGSERILDKFDHAARLFVAFNTFIGPPLTLNYIWGNVEKPGTVLQHPKSGRAQIFVLESGNAKAGQWISEERDITADWKRAFGDKTMPKIIGLGVMTDSDSLGGTLKGFYADITLTGGN